MTLNEVLDFARRTGGGKVEADVPLMDAGIDSLGAVELRNQLMAAAGQGVSLPSTLIFDYPTARQLATLLAPVAAEEDPSDSGVPTQGVSHTAGLTLDVAIDGFGVQLPARATSLPKARCLAASACDAISQMPVMRWDLSKHSVDESVANRMRHAAFVCDAELMDNQAFRISTSEAAAMDPQQRLVLEKGYEALHDASMNRVTLTEARWASLLACCQWNSSTCWLHLRWVAASTRQLALACRSQVGEYRSVWVCMGHVPQSTQLARLD